MLIRVVSHPTNNALHIDKLICLKGLPEKMMFDVRNGKRFLKEPWKMDPIENLPKYIRSAFEPETITLYTPPFKSPNGDYYQALEDDHEVVAVQIDYQNGQGEQLWKQIERMIDMSTPRDEKLPVPVVVAVNRTENMSITAEEIPVVDFAAKKEEGVEKKPQAPVAGDRRCQTCNKTFDREQQLRMHKARTGHRESKAVAA